MSDFGAICIALSIFIFGGCLKCGLDKIAAAIVIFSGTIEFEDVEDGEED